MALLSVFCTAKGHAQAMLQVPYRDVIQLNPEPYQAKIAYGSEPAQFMLRWYPENERAQAPILIYIHGGCWLKDYDIEHSKALTAALSKQGYVVYSVEYRRTGMPGGGWPGTFDDIQLAVDKVVKDYATRSVWLIGHSAGGHLALLASANNPNVDGAIGLAAITDVEAYSEGTNSCQQVTDDFFGGGPLALPQAYHDANPIHHKVRGVLLHGDADKIVPYAQSQKLTLPVVRVEGAGHFDWLHPQSVAFEALLKQLQDL